MTEHAVVFPPRRKRAVPWLGATLAALAITVASCGYGGCGSSGPGSTQRILLITESDDATAARTARQTRLALNDARIAFDVHELSSSTPWPDLARYSVVALAAPTDHLSERSGRTLRAFVARGGGLVVQTLRKAWPQPLGPVLGILSASADAKARREPRALGVRFEFDFLPGLSGMQPRDKTAAYPLSLTPDVRPILRSASQRPLAWNLRWKQGRVVVWTDDLLSSDMRRGLIVESVLRARPVAVRALANAAVIHVDDLPPPIHKKKLEPVATEFDVDDLAFYKRIWLPDLLALAREFNLVYTFLVTFTYNGTVQAPFGFEEWDRVTVQHGSQRIPLGESLVRDIGPTHELGLHGYNHQSLTLENWKTPQAMREGLEAAMARWHADQLGPLPRTYVPPNNSFDAAGAHAVRDAVPSIDVIAGSTTGPYEEGMYREFGPEPWNPELFHVPRVSAGYVLSPDVRLYVLSTLASLGVWTHFVHPNDIFDTPTVNTAPEYGPRNPENRPWRGERTGNNGFLPEFREWIALLREHYPWLRYRRNDAAGDRLRDHLANEMHVEFDGGRVEVRATIPGFLQVQVARPARIDPATLRGAAIVAEQPGLEFVRYTLEGSDTTVTFRLTDSPIASP